MARNTRASRLAPEARERSRIERILKGLGWRADDRAQRLRASRRLFGQRVLLFDPHTHSDYSDGSATVAMNEEAARRIGLDFLFATDHASLGQKRAVRRYPNMSWGQEPGAGRHHIGLLCNTRLFRPRRDSIAADFTRASRLAPFVWIPHPAGWYPRTVYTAEQIESLWTLGPSFAMEVLNGAHKIDVAYDHFDEAAVAAWDRLLCDGRRVTPLGASDAHVPEWIGSAWTAVPGTKATAEALIRKLRAGRCFASEAPLLDLRVEGRPMGSTVKRPRGQGCRVAFRAADAAGLQCVRLVSMGRAVRTIYPRDEPLVEGTWPLPAGCRVYVRLEVRAVDNRRAFSAPVYLEES